MTASETAGYRRDVRPSVLCLPLVLVACAPPPQCVDEGTAGATAACLEPVRPPDHYVRQAELYFDTLDVDAQREVEPTYAPQVARWEWPPWLLLTGLGAEDMLETADILRAADPSTVPERDCRFFAHQPFARCYVSFTYEGGPCPIYEEFTFNDAGEITFIEAWSDLPGLTPTSAADPWGEASDFPRLANRVPGLGDGQGRLRLNSEWMNAAAAEDPDVADFQRRAGDWWTFWLDALQGSPSDFFATGCGW